MNQRWRQLLAAGGVFAAVIVVAVVVLAVRAGSGPTAPATPATQPTSRSAELPHPGLPIPSGITLVPLHTVPLPGICAGPAEPAIPATGTATMSGGCPDAQGLKSGTPTK